MSVVFNVLNSLRFYCEKEDFRGWDPYDGLNSKVFQSLPLFKDSALARLIWIQFFKRSPINFRPIMQVPKGYNPKGIALFLQGYCNLYKVYHDNKKEQDKVLAKINYLANLLISLKTEGYSGACWGYNFDWQARRLFFFPKNTPTVVVTSFCAEALLNAYEITRDNKYKELAISSAEFIVKDLHKTPCGSGFLFSYSPLQGNDTVFNASLLGSKILTYIFNYTQNVVYLKNAKESIAACCEMQSNDGSWPYGMLPVQNWMDSFHTGYNIESLSVYQNLTGDTTFNLNLEKGIEYYVNNFFEKNGIPKYYHNKRYPIDIHCPAQFVITLYKLNGFKVNEELVDRVVSWMIKKMQSPRGYFYYQLRRHISAKISYMRWSNAFVFKALSSYLLYKTLESNPE
jgi:rhamnogalacturonyl hydrolase YesR